MDNLESDPINGQQISFELTNLFETAGGYGGLLAGKEAEIGLDGMDVNGEEGHGHTLDSFSSMWGDDTEFVRVMKECF
jgi:hypothetical protein